MSSSSSIVWFQIVESTNGEPYRGTAVDMVSVSSPADVADFRKAVKTKHPNILFSLDVVELFVYKNKFSFHKRNAAVDDGKEEPLKSSRSLDGLGTTKKEALVVAIQASPASNTRSSISDKLTQLKVEFCIRDIDYLLKNDPARSAFLIHPQLTPEEARTILAFAKSRIKTATQREIWLQHSYLLDGSMNASQGQAPSSLYYAYAESGKVFAAKIYNGNKESFLREVEVNQALEHKNLVKFVKTFSIQDDTRHIIIMPYFPRSVADWREYNPILPLPAVIVIARSCFDALCHLHSKQFCFADWKPSNIMLSNAEPGYATLVDYGATIRIGRPIIEYTPSYCLDANTTIATEQLDWICLGTTLAQICGFDILKFEQAADLVDEVLLSHTDGNLKKLMVSCLQSPSPSKIESALNLLE